MRGEKRGTGGLEPVRLGSPPRARGKGDRRCAGADSGGITPACAGKSTHFWSTQGRPGDHPRVRGEKPLVPVIQLVALGSPPRARGKDVTSFVSPSNRGITPACAGKSGDAGCEPGAGRDHPRVRGEKSSETSSTRKALGSPPRARGKVFIPRAFPVAEGITPACAGKRNRCRIRPAFRRDHPRVRGEKADVRPVVRGRWGSPPRARGKVTPVAPSAWADGITPACAGKRHQKKNL